MAGRRGEERRGDTHKPPCHTLGRQTVDFCVCLLNHKQVWVFFFVRFVTSSVGSLLNYFFFFPRKLVIVLENEDLIYPFFASEDAKMCECVGSRQYG